MTFLALLVSLFRRRPAPPPPVAPPVAPPAPADGPAALLAAHNAARATAGLAPLVLDSSLCAAAQGHARQMVRYGVAHDGIGDGTPEQRIKESGYMFREASENVAMGRLDAAEVVYAWLGDPPHRANILGPYVHLGGGMAVAANGLNCWCCVYGSPA